MVRKYLILFIILTILLFGCLLGKKPSQKFENFKITDSLSVSVDTIFIPKYEFEDVANAHQIGLPPNGEKERVITHQNVQTVSQNNFGQIVYKIPDTMKVFQDHKVIVRISKESDLINIQENLGSQVITSHIRVENRMEVKIVDPTGDNFKIVPVNRERQLIETGEYTQWTFNVIPLRAGRDLKLDIVVSIVIDEDTKEIVYTDAILVKSNPAKQVESWWVRNWHWVFEIMLIPFAIWVWNSIRKRIKENS